jgi:hypothetical protein
MREVVRMERETVNDNYGCGPQPWLVLTAAQPLAPKCQCRLGHSLWFQVTT